MLLSFLRNPARFLLASAVAALLWPLASFAEAAPDAIAVNVDQAKLVKLPARVATIVVGNPLIADVTLQNGGIVVVTGKGYGATNFIAMDRSGEVLAALESYPGQQLAIVRYTPDHGHIDDWVYNAPDIEKSKVIWARDMGTAKNVELLQYFRNRKVWLVEPDFNPPRVSPYGCAKANPPRPLDCSKLSIEVPLLSKKVLR